MSAQVIRIVRVLKLQKKTINGKVEFIPRLSIEKDHGGENYTINYTESGQRFLERRKYI